MEWSSNRATAKEINNKISKEDYKILQKFKDDVMKTR